MMNHEAVRKAYPQVVTTDDGTGAFDANGNQIEIDQALVDAAAAEIAAEVAATQYQRDRVPQYPDLKAFVDAYYWAQKGDNTLMDAYIAACDKVKADFPKP